MERRHDIDWLRVIAIFGVLYFHVAMLFVAEWDWHIKNPETSYLWLEFNFWISQFRMPLLFFVSGFGTFLALRKRSPWQYSKERHNRLMIPLIFSMFVIVPPQIYIERIFDDPESYSSFIEFYPQTFNLVPYPEGDFSWHHMWFVLYLFFYSLLGLPLFMWMKKERIGQQINRLFDNYQSAIILIIIPTFLVYVFITGGTNRSNDFINDWTWHPYWFSFFLIGFLVGIAPVIWDRIRDNRRNFLGLAFLCIVLINIIRWNRLEGEFVYMIYRIIIPINAWAWMLAACGYARIHLNKPSKLLTYLNQSIYPFYILHQTIIIIIGYYVVQVDESILTKYIFISTLSIIGSLGIYEFLIKPFRISRFLFGVKSAPRIKDPDQQ